MTSPALEALRRTVSRLSGRAFRRRAVAWTGERYENRIGRGRAAGVNLIGFPRGEFGIGQHLRTLAKALEASAIPYSVFDWGQTLHPQGDDRLDGQLDATCPYRTNVFCLNADGVLEVWTRHRQIFADRFNVGYGFWELDTYPDAWLWSMNVLDEVWAPSRHVGETLAARAAVPVVPMPVAVDVAPPPTLPRSELGVAEDVVLFGFPFDFSSQSDRKNPEGLVEAFRRAFPTARRDVALVLKSKTVEEDPGQIRARDALRLALPADDRILWIDESWPAERVHSLLATLDVVVSLHRAEGFGLVLGEAMRLGRPVVATGWSGNVDFTRPEAALLVPYQLVEVPEGAYFDLAAGARWAEPDLDVAAAHLRALADDADLRRRLGDAGREVILADHSPEVVGRRVAERLRLLGLLPPA